VEKKVKKVKLWSKLQTLSLILFYVLQFFFIFYVYRIEFINIIIKIFTTIIILLALVLHLISLFLIKSQKNFDKFSYRIKNLVSFLTLIKALLSLYYIIITIKDLSEKFNYDTLVVLIIAVLILLFSLIKFIIRIKRWDNKKRQFKKA